MSITITDEQLAEAHAWERRLLLGQCNLSEALFMCMSSGAPIPQFVIDAFVNAETQYAEGDVKELAEGFGYKITQRERQAMHKRNMENAARDTVDRFAEMGLPKIDPTQYEGTAFHAAGDALNRAPSTVYDYYFKKRPKKRA